MNLPNFDVSPSNHRLTSYPSCFVDTQKSHRHAGLYLCELITGVAEIPVFNWYAVMDDFGNLIEVTPGRHS